MAAWAHGGMFVVRGKAGGAPLGACGAKVADAFPIATSMNGTSMKIAMAGASFDVPMIYVVACGVNQLAGIVPSNVPVGGGTLTVSYSGHTGSAPITVVDRVPRSLHHQPGRHGRSHHSELQFVHRAPPSTRSPLPPSQGKSRLPGAPAWGPDGNSDVEAPKPTDIPVNFELYVGGKLATVDYKGRSGCCAGIDQIVFQVPNGVDGCYVPVVAKIGNSVSNFTTMSVSASGGPCSDPGGHHCRRRPRPRSATTRSAWES